MKNCESTLMNTGLKVSKPFLYLAVFFWFWSSRWVTHNRFLFRLKNPYLKPSILSLPFVYASLVYISMKKEFQRQFSRYVLEKYAIFTRQHYSIGGLGYFGGTQLNDSDRAALYRSEKGRIGYFLDHNKTLIPYKNGDTFLDAGCGKGQNIQVIIERYPNSKIWGFDISNDAVQIVKCGVVNNQNVTIDIKDICDMNFLSSIPEGSFDHVIVSHVIGFLSGPGIDETKVFRQQLIDHLIRICSTSVIILDTIEDIPEMTVEIEQNTRCIVHDRLINYFIKYTTTNRGEMYVMFSDESRGLLYLKRKKT